MSSSPEPFLVWIAEADGLAAGALQPAVEMLQGFGVRTHRVMLATGEQIPAITDDVCAVIVASPDAALPAALVAHTAIPVIRVPTPGGGRSGTALLLEGDNLPAGPADAVFATMAIGDPGAKNAALFVVASLATVHEGLRAAWSEFRTRQTEAVLQHPPLETKD